MTVNALGERAANPFHFRDVVYRRRLDAAQSAEVLDQRLAALGADAGDLVQHRSGARLAAPRAMADDRETVRLVADRLDEVQPRMHRRKLQGARFGLEDQLFETGLALGTFRHADYAHLVQAGLHQRRPGWVDLRLSAVDQHQVGNDPSAGGHALIAPPERLAHRAVVVARRDVADVEAPVLGFLHLLVVVDHAGGHGRLAHGVADIEALDALRPLGQAERLAQRMQPALLRRPVAHTLRDSQQRVLARHVEPNTPFTVRRVDDFGFFKIQVNILADDNQGGDRLFKVVLFEECRDHLAFGSAFGIRWKEAAVAHMSAGADHDQVYARDRALDGAGHHVGIDAAIRLDVLACLHARQRPHLVTVERGFFKVPVSRSRLHFQA